MVGIVYYIGQDQATRQASGFFAGSDHAQKYFDKNKFRAQTVINCFTDQLR